MALTSHSYASLDDLREMQAIVSAAWRSDRRPLVSCTVGDLAWWYAGSGPGVDWPARIRIWTDGTPVVGWGWFRPPESLDYFVAHGLEEQRERAVMSEIVGWGLDRLADHSSGAEEAPPALEAWAADGWLEADILTGLGFVPAAAELSQFFQPLDADLPEPVVPDGYTVRTVSGPDEIAARVEVHRAAFAPSKMTVEKYEILIGLEPYAFDRDVVAVAPDGSFAAFTMCWLDREAGIGEFEPVGTHPDHQRRGLGKAVNRYGLRLLRDAGARDAMVFSEASNAASEALYRSVGFRPIATHRSYICRPDAGG
jgi:mycothiol synthase